MREEVAEGLQEFIAVYPQRAPRLVEELEKRMWKASRYRKRLKVYVRR